MPTTTKKICLITPGHLASNPRLVKEAQSLAANGYQVHLIFTQYVPYLIDFDDVILKNNPGWTYNCLNRTSKSIYTKSQNYLAAALQKICLMLLLRGKNSDFNLCHAINRYFSWQLKQAIAIKADLYIAHNLAALPVAVFAAQKKQSKCGFDAEDFHRNEISDDETTIDFKLKSSIEDTFIPKLDYITVASPLIGKAYDQIYKNDPTCILNVFPKTQNRTKTQPEKKLKLVWFSQYIGLRRGLETVFAALNELTEVDCELHLIGFLSPEINDFMQSNSFPAKIFPKIKIHKSIPPDQLLSFISQFDIGLATELDQPLNRDICLSNKIFSYIQAGLAVLATDTTAQSELLLTNHGIGKLYDKNSIRNLTACIKDFDADRELLLSYKKNAFELGQNYLNWETESLKFLKIVAETLNN